MGSGSREYGASRAMRGIVRRMRWVGHDAAGEARPETVCAGVLSAGARAIPPHLLPLGPDEVIVIVPPQWIGGWDDGHPLAPVYQHLWQVPVSALEPLPDEPEDWPYRPETLPATATGPRPTRPARR